MTIRREEQTIYQQVLNPRSPSGEALSAWKWQYDGAYAFYHGLYPRAWTVYDIKEHNVVLTCRQVSPVFPHNYKVRLTLFVKFFDVFFFRHAAV